MECLNLFQLPDLVFTNTQSPQTCAKLQLIKESESYFPELIFEEYVYFCFHFKGITMQEAFKQQRLLFQNISALPVEVLCAQNVIINTPRQTVTPTRSELELSANPSEKGRKKKQGADFLTVFSLSLNTKKKNRKVIPFSKFILWEC